MQSRCSETRSGGEEERGNPARHLWREIRVLRRPDKGMRRFDGIGLPGAREKRRIWGPLLDPFEEGARQRLCGASAVHPASTRRL
jgi:hypothetical protein